MYVCKLLKNGAASLMDLSSIISPNSCSGIVCKYIAIGCINKRSSEAEAVIHEGRVGTGNPRVRMHNSISAIITCMHPQKLLYK